MNRLDTTLARLRDEGRSGLACYFTAGDPDFGDSLRLLCDLAAAGADVIELGMPFSDPVADGPVIQAAHNRARAAGQTVARTLELVRDLRLHDALTPLVLMGYVNPVMQYGMARFMADAARAGVDGLILVDLPVEQAAPYRAAARGAAVHLIGMTTPMSDDERLERVLADAGGFIYHVTLAGTTGSAACKPGDVAQDIARLRRHSRIPIAAGFGIRSAEQAGELAGIADLVVVGSRLVEVLAVSGIAAALAEVRRLAAAVRATGSA